MGTFATEERQTNLSSNKPLMTSEIGFTSIFWYSLCLILHPALIHSPQKRIVLLTTVTLKPLLALEPLKQLHITEYKFTATGLEYT